MKELCKKSLKYLWKELVLNKRFYYFLVELAFICLLGWCTRNFFLYFVHTKLFNNHVDAWIQTIGTIVGAFLGAAIAGWMAIRTIRYSEYKDRIKQESRFFTLLEQYLTHAISIVKNSSKEIDFFKKTKLNVNSNKQKSEEIIFMLDSLIYKFHDIEKHTNKIDYGIFTDKIYDLFSEMDYDVKSCIFYLERMRESVKINNSKFFQIALDSLEKSINKLDSSMFDSFQFTLQEIKKNKMIF